MFYLFEHSHSTHTYRKRNYIKRRHFTKPDGLEPLMVPCIMSDNFCCIVKASWLSDRNLIEKGEALKSSLKSCLRRSFKTRIPISRVSKSTSVPHRKTLIQNPFMCSSFEFFLKVVFTSLSRA